MKLLYTSALLLALAAPALADIGGDSITGNSGIANNGTVQNSVLNNNSGPAAGGTFNPSATASSTNTNVNTATGGTAIAGGGNASARSSARQGQVQGQSQNATSRVSGSGNSSVSIKDRKQAPAVFAPGLTNGYDCNGSASFGGSVAGFGIGGGTTTVSEACENVFLFRVLKAEKDEDGAWGILCETPKVKKHAKGCAKYRDQEHFGAKDRNDYPSTASDSPKH